MTMNKEEYDPNDLIHKERLCYSLDLVSHVIRFITTNEQHTFNFNFDNPSG